MREALTLKIRAALRARIDSLREAAARAAVDRNASNVKFVGIHVVIVAGIGHRAANELLDRLGSEDFGELEQHERLAHALTANRVGDAPQFARPGTHESQVSDGLRSPFRHVFTVAFSPP